MAAAAVFSVSAFAAEAITEALPVSVLKAVNTIYAPCTGLALEIAVHFTKMVTNIPQIWTSGLSAVIMKSQTENGSAYYAENT